MGDKGTFRESWFPPSTFDAVIGNPYDVFSPHQFPYGPRWGKSCAQDAP